MSGDRPGRLLPGVASPYVVWVIGQLASTPPYSAAVLSAQAAAAGAADGRRIERGFIAARRSERM